MTEPPGLYLHSRGYLSLISMHNTRSLPSRPIDLPPTHIRSLAYRHKGDKTRSTVRAHERESCLTQPRDEADALIVIQSILKHDRTWRVASAYKQYNAGRWMYRGMPWNLLARASPSASTVVSFPSLPRIYLLRL